MTGSGSKQVSLATDAGMQISDLSNADVYFFLKTAGSGTAIADDVMDPIIIIDNFVAKYNPLAWIAPAAGITANVEASNADSPLTGELGVEKTFGVHLQTKARLGSLKIIGDLSDDEKANGSLLTFLADGALKGNDGSGNYTEDVSYTITESTFTDGAWTKPEIVIDSPASGAVNDDMMLYFKATPTSLLAKKSRLELDCSTRIWYDVYFQGASEIYDLTGIDNPDILADTLPDVSNGAVILLEPGMTYNAGGYDFDKSIEFRSSDPDAMNMPIIDCSSNFGDVADANIGSIVFKNIALTGEFDGDYVINFDKGSTVGDIMLQSCTVSPMRGIVRMKDNPTTIDNFIISDCIIDSLYNYGVLTVDNADAQCKNILIENSTISRTQYFLRSKNNSNSITIQNCTFFEVPDVGRQMFRWDGGDGKEDVTNGIKIENCIFGHGWDMDNESKYGVKGVEGLANTTFTITNVYATSDFEFSSDSIAEFPSDTLDITSGELWVAPTMGVFNYLDANFAGIGNAGDPRWVVAVPPVLDTLYATSGTLNPVFDPETMTYQLTIPAGSTELGLVAEGYDVEISQLALTDGMDGMTDVVVKDMYGVPNTYKVYVHVQSDNEILYLSADSRGVMAEAKDFDKKPFQMLKDAGYSVTFAKKGAIFEWTPDGIVPFDYTPYMGMVVSAGESSSNVNDYAKRNYPIPCVSMQTDGPRSDKWGWIGVKKDDNAQMNITKVYDVETAKIKITNIDHYITSVYAVDDLIQWTLGTADSADWSGKEVKSYNLTDSIPEAIPLATIPADGTSLTTMWAVPAGTSVRSMNGDYSIYERVTTTSNVVFFSLFNDGLLYASDEFGTLLVRSLEWAMGTEASANLASLTSSKGELAPVFDPEKTEYQLNLPKGTSSVKLSATAASPNAEVVVPEELSLSDGTDQTVSVVVTSADGTITKTYNVMVHVQSDNELLYLSADSNGAYGGAKAYDKNVYDDLVEAGYSVTFAKKGAIFEWTPDGIVPFDYTPYMGMVISAGESSSNVNDYAKRNYPIPCVSMQTDGPKSDKWGWIGVKKDDNTQMNITKVYDVETAKIKVTNIDHYITSVYAVDDLIQWTLGTADSADWSGKEVKSYNLTDSIPEAIPLATIPADGTSLTTMWAIPSGTSVRSMNGDYTTYERVTTSSRIVFMSLFNDGLLYASDDFASLLNRSVEWVLGQDSVAILASLSSSEGTLVSAFDPEKTEYQLNLPKGTSSVSLTATAGTPNATVTIPDALTLSDGMTTIMTVTVTSGDGTKTKDYNVMVHVQSEDEILFVSNSNGVYGSADANTTNTYDALVDAGYSVTIADKLALNVEGYDYTPYSGLVIGAGVGSSWVNNFAKDGYPLPCVTMQHDGPRSGKWGWVGTDKDNNLEMNVVKTATDTPVDSIKMQITNINHYVTNVYQLGELVEWNTEYADAGDEWSDSEVKSYNLTDSIPEAIPLGRIPVDGSALTSWWAIPAGSSVRSLTPDGYSRVTLENRIVYLGVYGNGLLYAADAFDVILVRSLEWVLGAAPDAIDNVGKATSDVILYPNPAIDQATLRFTLAQKEEVSLTLYTMMGQKIEIQQKQLMMSGTNEINIATSALDRGLYIYRLNIGSKSVTGKMSVTK